MRYNYLRLIFFIGHLSAFQYNIEPYPYVSPGIQIGLTGDAKFFFSAQIKGGYIPITAQITGGYNPFEEHICICITIGKRFGRNKNMLTMIFKFLLLQE